MKVSLVRYTTDPLNAIETAASNCYDSKPNGKIMNACYKSGHHSVLEFAQFHFHIEGISRACYDVDTKVLTNNGWKYIKDVDIKNDCICSLNDNGEIEYVNAIKKISYHYNGTMDWYKSTQVDLLVTPDHRMWVEDYEKRKYHREKNWKFIPSNQLTNLRYGFLKSSLGIRRQGLTKIEIPTVVRQHHLPFKGFTIGEDQVNHFLELLGIWVTDGCVVYGTTHNNARKTGNRIIISQTKSHVVRRISYLLEQLEIKYTYQEKYHGFKISNQPLFDWLVKNFIKGKNTHKTYYLKLPRWMFKTLNIENIESFLKGVFLGNGSFFTRGLKQEIDDTFSLTEGYNISTCSKDFCEDIVELALLSGKCANIKTVPPRLRTFPTGKTIMCKQQYMVSVLKNGYHLFNTRPNKSSVSYCDNVYCLELEKYHRMYVMRNGKSCWCGNCSHQLVRTRTASFAQRSQRYVNEDGFGFVTPPKILTSHHAKASYDRLMHHIQSTYEELQRLGIPNEDARFVLPNACETVIDMSIDFRNLCHFMNERLCKKAQWEIRELAQKMRQLVIDVFPEAASMLVPKCERFEIGFCPEQKPCGRRPKLSEMIHSTESDGE